MSDLREQIEKLWAEQATDGWSGNAVCVGELFIEDLRILLAASEAERAPDLVIRRLPDWNYAAFLNQTDASCIAIGTTEQEARNNGMRELLKGYAERAAGVRAGLEMAVKWLLYVGGVDHETLLDILRESLAPEDDVDVKAEFTDLQRALIPQPAAPASSGPEWATKVLIDPNASLSEVAEALDALDAVGADAQPTSAAKVVAEQNSAGKWTHWPSGKPAPAPILGEPHGWNIEQILVYIWQCMSGEQSAEEYPYERFRDSEMGKRLRLELSAPAILGEMEGLRERHAIEWELVPETSLSAGDEISLVRRDGFKGRRWAIKQRGYVLNKSGEWEHEPIPSSRTEEWLETVRWTSSKEAIAALDALIKRLGAAK